MERELKESGTKMEILEQQLSPYSWMGFTKAAVDKPTSMLNIGKGDF